MANSKAIVNTGAKTKQQALAQNSRERLWDTLDQAYGVEREASNKAYNQNYSQSAREALAKGMGRSSFSGQTLANINTEKANAQNKIYNQQMAAFQQGLNDIEEREAEEAYRNAQLSLQAQQLEMQQKQYEQNMAYQRERDQINDAFKEKEYTDSRADKADDIAYRNMVYGDSRTDKADEIAYRNMVYGDSRTDRADDIAYRDKVYADSRTDKADEIAYRDKVFNYGVEGDYRNYAAAEIEYAMKTGGTPTQKALDTMGWTMDDYNSIMNKSGTENGSSGTVTWRQQEDAQAKALGFKNRNDPAYKAYMNGNGNPGTTTKPTDSSTLGALDNGTTGTPKTDPWYEIAYAIDSFNSDLNEKLKNKKH